MDQAVTKNNSSTLIAARFRCGRDNLKFTIIFCVVKSKVCDKHAHSKHRQISRFPLFLCSSAVEKIYTSNTVMICYAIEIHATHLEYCTCTLEVEYMLGMSPVVVCRQRHI